MLVRMLVLVSIFLNHAVPCVVRAVQWLLIEPILLLVPHGGAVKLLSILALILCSSPWPIDLKVAGCLICVCCYGPIAAIDLHRTREDMHTKHMKR